MFGLLGTVGLFSLTGPSNNPVVKIMRESPAYTAWLKVTIPLGLLTCVILLAADAPVVNTHPNKQGRTGTSHQRGRELRARNTPPTRFTSLAKPDDYVPPKQGLTCGEKDKKYPELNSNRNAIP